MKRLALVACFLLPAGVLVAAPHGSGVSHAGRAGGSSAPRVNSRSRATMGSRANSATVHRPAGATAAAKNGSSSNSTSTGGAASGNSMAGGCMNSHSTGTRALRMIILSTLRFGGTAFVGYGLYAGNLAGYGYGGGAYGGNGYYSTGYSSNGSNNGNSNPLNIQAAAGGNNALAKLNPFQLTQQQAAAAPDAQDSAPLELPARDWTNATGDAIVEGQFVGVLDGKVVVRKSSGGISLLALDQLSADDQQYVASVAGHKAAPAAAASE